VLEFLAAPRLTWSNFMGESHFDNKSKDGSNNNNNNNNNSDGSDHGNSSSVNGAGFRPPGWNQPNNPHSQTGGTEVAPAVPTATGGTTPHHKPSVNDIINASFERYNNPGHGLDSNLGDFIFLPPLSNFNRAARDLTQQANQAEGRPTIVNMAILVDGQQISGPVAYTKAGQEYIIDQETKQKYAILPPSDQYPQGAVKALSQSTDAQPAPITASKVIQGFGDATAFAFSDVKPPAPTTVVSDPPPPPAEKTPPPPPTAEQRPPEFSFNNFSQNQWQQFQQFQQQGAFAVNPDGNFARPDLAISAATNLGLKPTDLALINQLKNPTADQLQNTMDQIQAAQRRKQEEQQLQLTADQLKYLQQQLTQNPDLLQQLIKSNDARAAALLALLEQRGMLPGQQRPDDTSKQLQGMMEGKRPTDAKQMVADAIMLTRNLDPLVQNQGARQAILDSLIKAQNGKSPFDPDSPQHKQWQDVIKALGPDRISQLRGLFEDGKPLRPDGKYDANTQTKVRELLELILLASKRNQGDQAANQTINTRLAGQDRPAGLRLPDDVASRAALIELARTLKDQPGKPGDAALREILARTPDGKVRPDRTEFSIKDDPTTKALLERMFGKKQEGDAPTRDTKHGARQIDERHLKPDEILRAMMTRHVGQKPEGQKTDTDRRTRLDEEAAAREEAADDNTIALEHGVPADEDAMVEDAVARRPEDADAAEAELEGMMLGTLQRKQRQQETDEDKQETTAERDKKEPEKRQKYIVKDGDTLESIAGKLLRDKRLSALIYEINQDTIPVRMVRGRRVAELQPKMVIWLPTTTDIRDYRARLLGGPAVVEHEPEFESAEQELAARFGKNWGGDTADDGASDAVRGGADDADDSESDAETSLDEMERSARAAYQSRRAHIESLLGPLSARNEDKPKYVVRLGDTLKSVAMKHPALNDVSLWKLLAEVNNLPTKLDDRGNPVAQIKRGQILILPLQSQIDAFKRREAIDSGTGKRTKDKSDLSMPTRACPDCGRKTFASAVICPACGADFAAAPQAVAEPPAVASDPSKNRSRNPRKTGSKMKTLSAAAAENAAATPTQAPATGGDRPSTNENSKTKLATRTSARPPIEMPEYVETAELSDQARLLQAGTADNYATGFGLRLEMSTPGGWLPVVSYEIFADVSLRHKFKPDGQCQTIRIDLPPAAACELAENDLNSNWDEYCQQFARSEPPK
jgi:hypothetical protein